MTIIGEDDRSSNGVDIPSRKCHTRANMAASGLRTVGYDGATIITGLKIRALRRLVAAHRIPHIRYSDRVVRFDARVLEAWVMAKVVPVKEAA